MTMKRDFARVVGGMAVVVLAQTLVATPVLAQGEVVNDCVCIVDAGTVGIVTTASGWVKLNGDGGLIDAQSNARLSLGSVLQTGVAGSASATVGSNCNVDVDALSKMSIVELEDKRLCVRIAEEKPVVVIPPVAIVGTTAAALATTAVIVGLGQTAPVSQ